jgi:hypothetical protein
MFRHASYYRKKASVPASRVVFVLDGSRYFGLGRGEIPRLTFSDVGWAWVGLEVWNRSASISPCLENQHLKQTAVASSTSV